MNANLRHEDVKKACQAILDAFHAHALDFAEIPSLTPFKDIEIKSARQLFGDEQKEASSAMPDHIRNFLTAGQLLTKHSKTAPPRPRHVYCTADLKWLVWKDPKKPLHPDNKMKTWKLKGVERGRPTQQLQRKRFGKFLCREEGGFAIMGRERNVDLEAERREGPREVVRGHQRTRRLPQTHEEERGAVRQGRGVRAGRGSHGSIGGGNVDGRRGGVTALGVHPSCDLLHGEVYRG